MGDSCQALPLSGSPLHYLTAVSYEKGWKILSPVVSIYKKIVLPETFGGPTIGDPAEYVSTWWILFCTVPMFCLFPAIHTAVVDPVIKVSMFIFWMCGYCIYFLVVYSVFYRYRDMPFELIGANAKFMIEVIPMITAAALHHLLEFSYGYLGLVLACSTNFYVFARFMHIAYDISGIDVMLGILMQVLAYMLNAELLVRALALSFCFGLSFYRYMTYCAPEVPAHHKKELEVLAC